MQDTKWIFLEENALAKSQAALRNTVTATRFRIQLCPIFKKKDNSIVLVFLFSQLVTGICFLCLKGGAGCSINCKCDDCKNPYGKKGNINLVPTLETSESLNCKMLKSVLCKMICAYWVDG